MEYGYTVLMVAFGAGILFYALLAAIFKSKKLLPYMRRYAAKMDNEKEYMTKFAKIMALVAIAPIASGLLALLLPEWTAGIVLIGLFIILITIGAKTTKING